MQGGADYYVPHIEPAGEQSLFQHFFYKKETKFTSVIFNTSGGLQRDLDPHRRGEEDADSRGLPDPDAAAAHKGGGEVAKEDQKEDQEQGELVFFKKTCFIGNVSFSQLFFVQISAQESRRKKKEFVDTLERQVKMT